MADPVFIRPARPEDLSACCRLLKALFSIEADFSFDADRALAALAILVETAPDHVVYVAEEDGHLIGMVSVQTLISTAEGGAAAILEDLVVREGYRGRGIGTRLLEAVERWCAARGITRIQLLADTANAPALAFYAAKGWQTTQLVALRQRYAAEVES